MAIHKIVLDDDDLAEDFSLVAIHCSEEAYKLAFLLNQKLKLSLHRRNSDIQFTHDSLEVQFPIFDFEDALQYTNYYLVGNKCKSSVAMAANEGDLFTETTTERSVINHLLPEFPKADFFLKIETDFEQIPLRKNIALINEVNQVISAYEVEPHQIKSNNNLIFN
ncbi:MAG: IPExxxVDY family protein [Bacteroidota bacterium]